MTACGPVLHAADASFARDGITLVPPFSIDVGASERAALSTTDARSARIAARMVAGIVKATTGTLLLRDFDPRIQPVQAKRVTGYVPCAGDFGDGPFARGVPDARAAAIALHAALFEVATTEAHRRVRVALAALGDDSPIAFATALALMRPIALLVLDRPPAGFVQRVEPLLPPRAAVIGVAVRVERPLSVASIP